MKKETQFCTLEPTFPPEAYIASVFAVMESGAPIMYTLSGLFETTQEISDSILEMSANVNKKNYLDVETHAIVMQVTFENVYPLRPEFWDKPTVHYDSFDRLKSFIPVVSTPHLYKLLVTPFVFDQNEKWFFSAALPFRISVSPQVLEQFMLSSDHPVEVRSKYAAIYTIGAPKRYNWKTKIFEEKDREKNKEQKLSN